MGVQPIRRSDPSRGAAKGTVLGVVRGMLGAGVINRDKWLDFGADVSCHECPKRGHVTLGKDTQQLPPSVGYLEFGVHFSSSLVEVDLQHTPLYIQCVCRINSETSQPSKPQVFGEGAR